MRIDIGESSEFAASEANPRIIFDLARVPNIRRLPVNSNGALFSSSGIF